MTKSFLVTSNIMLSLRLMMSMWLSRETTVAIILPQRDFDSTAPLSTHRPTSMIVLTSLAESILLRGVGQTDSLDNHRGLAVAAVVVIDELAAAIGTEKLEANLVRHD